MVELNSKFSIISKGHTFDANESIKKIFSRAKVEYENMHNDMEAQREAKAADHDGEDCESNTDSLHTESDVNESHIVKLSDDNGSDDGEDDFGALLSE